MADLRVTLIQSQIHWQDKKANLAMFEDKIRNLSVRTEIVVLPEMFSTGFVTIPDELAETMDDVTVQWMKKLASEKRIIITGSIIAKETDESGITRYYNRLIWMLPNGQFGYYDKRHRFAFAGEDQRYTSGSKRLIAAVNGWKINLLICYDLRFPVWSRIAPPALSSQVAEPGQKPAQDDLEFDLIIYVANWPEKRNHAWKTLLQARAIENQCYVIGTNRIGDDGNEIHYSGDSMVVDPLGEILYHKEGVEDIATIVLDKANLATIREKFPFWRDRDEFSIH